MCDCDMLPPNHEPDIAQSTYIPKTLPDWRCCSCATQPSPQTSARPFLPYRRLFAPRAALYPFASSRVRGEARYRTSVPFPLPAHRTQHADFPHYALRLVSSQAYDGWSHERPPCSPPSWRRDTACSEGSRFHSVVRKLTPIHTPSPSSTSTPEVRVLSSTGVTRHQRSYDPVRPPPAPPPCGDVEAATLVPNGHPPITRLTFRTCRAHYPDGPGWVRLSVATPSHTGLPRYSGGSASITSLSRPAQTSLALRPAGLLNRPKAAFVTRLRPARLPRHAARQLPGPTDNFLGGSSLHW